MMHTFRFLSLFSIVGFLVGTAGSALADDLAPPIYRGAPNSVMAKFDLFGGPPIQFSEGANPTYPLDPLTPFIGNPTPGTNSIIYPLALPNYIDQEPLKKIRIQYSWFGSPTAGSNAGAISILPSPGGVVQQVNATLPTNVSGNIFHRWDDYEIRPNPDSERFEIEFINADPRWIIIDTISLPEPGTLAILLLGSSLALTARRR